MTPAITMRDVRKASDAIFFNLAISVALRGLAELDFLVVESPLLCLESDFLSPAASASMAAIEALVEGLILALIIGFEMEVVMD